MKIKKELFQALVLSIFLYNAECWSLSGIQKNWAGGIYRQLIIMAFGRRSWRVGRQKVWETNKQLLQRTGLPTFNYILGYKKIMWVAHIIRGDEPMVQQALKISSGGERKKPPDRWWTRYNKELEDMKLTHEKVKTHAHQPSTLKKLIRELNNTSAA